MASPVFHWGDVRAINVELRAPGSPLAAIRSALVHFSERKDLSSIDGCMGINAICEFGMRDEDVTRITRRAANPQRHALMDTLRRAQMEGELDAQTNIESLADFFEATLAGIRIAAKAGKTRPAGSGSVLPSHGRPLSMTADRSGWSRMALEPASRSSSPAS